MSRVTADPSKHRGCSTQPAAANPIHILSVRPASKQDFRYVPQSSFSEEHSASVMTRQARVRCLRAMCRTDVGLIWTCGVQFSGMRRLQRQEQVFHFPCQPAQSLRPCIALYRLRSAYLFTISVINHQALAFTDEAVLEDWIEI